MTAIDLAGNESRLSGGRSRQILEITERPPPTGLIVRHLKDGSNLPIWKGIGSNELLGYLVFRSAERGKTYLQVSSITVPPQFKDKDVQGNGELWYRVKAVYRNGRISDSSKPAVWKRSRKKK